MSLPLRDDHASDPSSAPFSNVYRGRVAPVSGRDRSTASLTGWTPHLGAERRFKSELLKSVAGSSCPLHRGVDFKNLTLESVGAAIVSSARATPHDTASSMKLALDKVPENVRTLELEAQADGLSKEERLLRRRKSRKAQKKWNDEVDSRRAAEDAKELGPNSV